MGTLDAHNRNIATTGRLDHRVRQQTQIAPLLTEVLGPGSRHRQIRTKTHRTGVLTRRNRDRVHIALFERIMHRRVVHRTLDRRTR